MATLNTIRLTDNQKIVLCIIKSSETPTLAIGEISKGDENLINAKNSMANVDQFDPPLITVNDNDIQITDAGLQRMHDENLIDENDTLTSDGQSYANKQIPTTSTNNSLSGNQEPNTFEASEFFKLIQDLTYL